MKQKQIEGTEQQCKNEIKNDFDVYDNEMFKKDTRLEWWNWLS